MRNLLTAVVVVLLVLGATVTHNARAESSEIDNVQQLLAKRFPSNKVVKVVPAAWPGMFEVYTADEIVYTDSGVNFLMMGQLLDAKTLQNLTTQHWNEFQSIDYKALPFDKAIRIARGKGTRELAIFEDPRCPYCQELETDLLSVDDVVVYVFLYPLETVHPGATATARKIWCASDRAATWLDWMATKTEPVVKECDNTPIEELAKLGSTLKINSTPTLFLPDGSRVSGAPTKEALLRMLAVQKMAGESVPQAAVVDHGSATASATP